MRFFDLLIMSVNNLRRRKLRTGLTVLGVVIGTASIVVMVSLGIGLKEMTVEQYASYGSLTRIQVYQSYGMGGEQTEDSFLVDDTVLLFQQIPDQLSIIGYLLICGSGIALFLYHRCQEDCVKR